MQRDDEAREGRLRRLAKREGLLLRKSRARQIHADDLGGYQIVDPEMNAIIQGGRFDLALDDVEDYLRAS